MKQYIALTNIMHNGKLVKTKEPIELSDDEFLELKDHVQLPKEDDKSSASTPSMPTNELKKVEAFVEQYLEKSSGNGKIKSGDVMKEINLTYPGLLGNKELKKQIEKVVADKLA